MCNQCNDYRRIHTGKVVYGVFHNGKYEVVMNTEGSAKRARDLMSGMNGTKYCTCQNDDECVWEVLQIERRSISWEH